MGTSGQESVAKGNFVPDLYAHKPSILQDLETMSELGTIDLFYADETHGSSEGYAGGSPVPYGWQFSDEKVAIYVEKEHTINIVGLTSRQNQCHFKTTVAGITSNFVCEFFEALLFKTTKETVVALDNASIHGAKIIQERKSIGGTERDFFGGTAPPCSPHLNRAETLWRKIKAEWLLPEEYLEKRYFVRCCESLYGKD